MKNIFLIMLLTVLISSCKNDRNKEADLSPVLKNDSIILTKDSVKNNKIKEKSENKVTQIKNILEVKNPEKIVLEKHYSEENKKTILEFKYPVLNENINSQFKNFNSYLKRELVDKTIKSMKENESFIQLCDTVKTRKQKSIINYSINESNNFVSSVFVIENYYNGSTHSVVSFKTVNYDLAATKVLKFDDYFNSDSKSKVLSILNKVITTNISTGDMYYDCWEISEGDFDIYKDNFIVEGDIIKFYFDDCIVCPSYTGTYHIEVNKEQLKENINPTYLINSDLNEFFQ